jgi:putative intracellular protease/amidase
MIIRLLSIAALTLPATAMAADEVKKPILLVLTNEAKLGKTEGRTGFYLSEAAHPHEVFTKAGYKVTLASPMGGFAPLDPKSYDEKDGTNAAFWKEFGSGEEKNATLGVKETISLSGVNPADFSAVFFAGGHGTMWDFRGNKEINRITATIYEDGGVVGAVCHGPAALVDVKLTDGTPLVKGKKVAAFTNDEEEAVGLAAVVPFLLQSQLEEAGATHVPAENFAENAVADGRLVTGQNPASAKKTAELLVAALATTEGTGEAAAPEEKKAEGEDVPKAEAVEDQAEGE